MTAAREAAGAYTTKSNLVALAPAQQRVDRLGCQRPGGPEPRPTRHRRKR